MINRKWPHAVQATKKRDVGMELIRKYILPKVPMYSKKLSVCEVENRIKNIGYLTMKRRKSCLKRNYLNLDRFVM